MSKSKQSASPRQWKSRLRDMQEATEKIINYCGNIQSEAAFSADSKTLDACVRNFQILGDAAKLVPAAVQKELQDVPWSKIKGMRNVLVHEYFGVSSKILWKTIQKDLPVLLNGLKETNKHLSEPVHPWRICPPGETYVRAASVQAHTRSGRPVKQHLRQDHCRENHASGKNILSASEITDIADLFFKELSGPPSADDLGFGKRGTQFDSMIRGWVQYWNEVFKPEVALDPNIVKALIASESSFNPSVGKSGRGNARGLMQLMPLTIRSLNGAKGELKDHLFEVEPTDVLDPNINISAGVRWLFRKKQTATARLGRNATWEETIEEYKDYLRRRLKNPKAKLKGMENFQRHLNQLKKNGSEK